MDSTKFQDNIFKTIRDYIVLILQEFKCNKTEFGSITKKINNDLYEVEINGVNTTCYSCDDRVYNVGDVVIIIILNSNRRMKYILSKMKND